jgi:hypothetical protein
MRSDTIAGMGSRTARKTLGYWMVATGVALAGAGCGSDEPRDDADPIGPEAYEVVLAEFLPPPPTDEDADLPIVYVAPLGGAPLSLDLQVAIIESVATTHDLRFVDDAAAAVDDDDGDAPPRHDGLLLGVGIIPENEPHTVRVEVYSEVDRVRAYRLTLIEQNATWLVETSEPVDPEGLVGDE